MTRMLLAISAVLGALCLVQWNTLRQLKSELAGANGHAYRTALGEMSERREEIDRTIAWLDAYTRAEAGTGVAVLCDAGPTDVAGVSEAVSHVYRYLSARGTGATEVDARQQVIDAIAASGPEPPVR